MPEFTHSQLGAAQYHQSAPVKHEFKCSPTRMEIESLQLTRNGLAQSLTSRSDGVCLLLRPQLHTNKCFYLCIRNNLCPY